MDEIVKKTIENLKKHNMTGYYVQNSEQLIATIKSLLKEGEIIGCGDSVTLEEAKVFESIRKGNYRFLDKHLADQNRKINEKYIYKILEQIHFYLESMQ